MLLALQLENLLGPQSSDSVTLPETVPLAEALVVAPLVAVDLAETVPLAEALTASAASAVTLTETVALAEAITVEVIRPPPPPIQALPLTGGYVGWGPWRTPRYVARPRPLPPPAPPPEPAPTPDTTPVVAAGEPAPPAPAPGPVPRTPWGWVALGAAAVLAAGVVGGVYSRMHTTPRPRRRGPP